jgi:hypothetical protein
MLAACRVSCEPLCVFCASAAPCLAEDALTSVLHCMLSLSLCLLACFCDTVLILQPPPPMAGQPYLVPPAQAAWAPPPPSGNTAGSFGGFPAHPAAGAGTPALVYGLGQGGEPHATAPAAPPVPQQQQQLVYTPPVVMQRMEGAPSDNIYPDIPKQ